MNNTTPATDAPWAAQYLGQVKRHDAWGLLIRGIIAMIIAIAMQVLPTISSIAVVTMVTVGVCAWLVLDGIALIGTSIAQLRLKSRRWGWFLAGGLLLIVDGIFVGFAPFLTTLTAALIVLTSIANALIIRGIINIGVGHFDIVIGLVNLLLGLALLWYVMLSPAAAIDSLVALVVVSAGISGVAALVMAISMLVYLKKNNLD